MSRKNYVTVAAGQTDAVLGAGARADTISVLTIIPASTSPGAVTIKDGAGAPITVFAGGSNSLSTLHPFSVILGLTSLDGAWSVTTGASVSVIAAGDFT